MKKINQEQLKYLTETFWESDDYSLSQRNAQDKNTIEYSKQKHYEPKILYAYGQLEMSEELKSYSLETQIALVFDLFENDDDLPESIYQDILNVYWENNLS